MDDEPALVQLVVSQLKSLGYEVTSRSSNTHPLSLFRDRSDKFDLVITDMTMPIMSGDEFAEELKRIKPDIPVVLCAGFSSKITPDKARNVDIDTFLMKPIILREMARIIRSVLGDGLGLSGVGQR